MSPASPTISTTPARPRHAGQQHAADPDRLGHAGGRLPPDRHDHLHAVTWAARLVDTETATVSGNGTYTTPTGYTLPTTGTVTGTYQWDASYSGDGNNNTVSDTNATDGAGDGEPGQPDADTTPSPTTVTLGSTTPPVLTDTATLSGGYHETGTITFTLFTWAARRWTRRRSRSAATAPTRTPTGYTLPTTGTVTGTYQWDASYSGDGNNNTVSDTNATNEQVTVSSASPTLSTTPSPTSITLGNARRRP